MMEDSASSTMAAGVSSDAHRQRARVINEATLDAGADVYPTCTVVNSVEGWFVFQ